MLKPGKDSRRGNRIARGWDKSEHAGGQACGKKDGMCPVASILSPAVAITYHKPEHSLAARREASNRGGSHLLAAVKRCCETSAKCHNNLGRKDRGKRENMNWRKRIGVVAVVLVLAALLFYGYERLGWLRKAADADLLSKMPADAGAVL